MKHLLLKSFLLTLIFIVSGFNLSAQYQNLGDVTKAPQQFKEPSPWFVGGMIGGGFSASGGSFDVSPIIGYKLSPKMQVGTRLTYIYSSYDYGSPIGRQSYNDYGGSLFGRYRFIEQAFVHVEYEILRVQYPSIYGTGFEITNHTVNSLFVGGGMIQSIGGRGFTTISVLFNVLESDYSPYSNPIIRVGFGVGL